MKCIQYNKPNNSILRVSDETADAAVRSGAARYISKKEWKEKIRNPARTEAWMATLKTSRL